MLVSGKLLVIDGKETAVGQFGGRGIAEIPIGRIVADDPIPRPTLPIVTFAQDKGAVVCAGVIW